MFVTFVSIGHTLAKIKRIKNVFIDFDNHYEKEPLRKLFSVTLTYFLKVKNISISEMVSTSAKISRLLL